MVDLSPGMAAPPLQLSMKPCEAIPRLTPRQTRACRLLCSGLTRKQIAMRMRVSEYWAGELVRQASHRLGVTTDASLGAVLALAGLVVVESHGAGNRVR